MKLEATYELIYIVIFTLQSLPERRGIHQPWMIFQNRCCQNIKMFP